MHGRDVLEEELFGVISGEVQGVGFRAITKHWAHQLQLKGFVRNLPDGNVEICAQGKKEQLDQLLNHLSREFPYANFDACSFRNLTSVYSDFQIVR